MPQNVAVVFVHGIFANGIRYSERMQKKILALLPQALRRYVHFEEVFWAGPVRGRQSAYMRNARDEGGIVENKLRTFFIEGLGDAAAYQKTKERENSIYYQVHDEINHTLRRFDQRVHRSTPLIFVGHSLGSYIISSYVWDMNRLKRRSDADIASDPDKMVREVHAELKGATDLCRLETLAGLVTFGCNIPLFTFTFGPGRIYPVTRPPSDGAGGTLRAAFPGVKLPAVLRDSAQWLNFYSPRDVLGYPLKPLNQYFAEEKRISDVMVRSEAMWSRLLPYWSGYSAHVGYWKNTTVISGTAKLIRGIVEADVMPVSAAQAAAAKEMRPDI